MSTELALCLTSSFGAFSTLASCREQTKRSPKADLLHHLTLPLLEHAMEPSDVGWNLPQQLDLDCRLSTPVSRQPLGLQASQKQLTSLSVAEKGEL